MRVTKDWFVLRNAVVSFFCCLYAGVAAAEVAAVQTAAESMVLGGEFRSELIYNDHGLEKTDQRDSKLLRLR